MLEIKSVSKQYKSGAEDVMALKGVSLQLLPGDYVSIVGPSGAGKSTLLHIMGGLDKPTSGEVAWKDQQINTMSDPVLSRWRNRTIGFVFQFYHLIEELTVLENVVISSWNENRKSSLKRAEELLKYLGVDDRKDFYPSQLSGGQKQKAAIARALINDPEIILCDEPTGNLDKDSQGKVIELLEQLNRQKNKTLVLITHNLDLARRAKKIMKIEAGEVSKGL